MHSSVKTNRGGEKSGRSEISLYSGVRDVSITWIYTSKCSKYHAIGVVISHSFISGGKFMVTGNLNRRNF